MDSNRWHALDQQLDLAGDGSFLFYHSIYIYIYPSGFNHFGGIGIYVGTGWVGLSFTEGVRMVPNVAIIG
jgi:hypothetical protein